MAFPPNPEEKPDPMENMPAVRARIPEHVARGEVSTGVIVVTGPTEYLLDFVRNLPRPNCIVARVVLPHLVMPQFIEALSTNIDMFRNRYGELPGAPASVIQTPSGGQAAQVPASQAVQPKPPGIGGGYQPPPPEPMTQPPIEQGLNTLDSSPIEVHPGAPAPQAAANNPNVMKRQNPQDVYDDLKLRDEILSGSYANAVMIGHGPYEFSFDFITNFYPQSAVSCRVYMASGHILRMLDSLKASWEQMRARYGYPPTP